MRLHYDRLRIWWEEDTPYEGTVTECATQLGVDCKLTLAFRVAYDDGDDVRHVLGDYPLEKLNGKGPSRPEPTRHTRVTPKDESSLMGGKRTRGGENGGNGGAAAAAGKLPRRA